MNNFKVAIIQHKSQNVDHIAENTKKAISFIEEAKANNADFVLFPECFLTSYYAPATSRPLRPVQEIEQDYEFSKWCKTALADDSPYIEQIRAVARANMIGVGITAFTRGRKYPQNSVFVIDRNGEILMKYSKVHTCDFDWERYLEDGDAFYVCEFDGICIGAMICYDREHPESARELMLQGAELVIVPNDCGAMYPRLQELSVQAMQNMSGVVMANPPGADKGNSCAFHPIVWDDYGKCCDNTIVIADSNYDGIVYADFDIKAIREYRAQEFLGKNRKPAAYKYLLKK